jgi:hypothetical protein
LHVFDLSNIKLNQQIALRVLFLGILGSKKTISLASFHLQRILDMKT